MESGQRVTARVPARMRITDTELCVLLREPANNAIEACQSVSEEEGALSNLYGYCRSSFIYSGNDRDAGKSREGMENCSKHQARQGIHGFGLQRVDRSWKNNGVFLDGNRKRAYLPRRFFPID